MQQRHATATVDHIHPTWASMAAPAGYTPDLPRATRTERLPFTIKVASDEASLLKAIDIRQTAYGRHVPELARHLGTPEPCDRDVDTVILLAEAKLDGAALGTMRIQFNTHGPLGLEASAPLPGWLRHSRLAEATRLGVTGGGVGRVVKAALFKAFYQYCLSAEIDWMVITARAPLDRQYEALLFRDVFPDAPFIPMHHVGGIPHRVMAFEVATARTRWQAAGHPLLDFMCHTRHPDVKIDGLPSRAATPSPARPASPTRMTEPMASVELQQ